MCVCTYKHILADTMTRGEREREQTRQVLTVARLGPTPLAAHWTVCASLAFGSIHSKLGSLHKSPTLTDQPKIHKLEGKSFSWKPRCASNK